MQSGLNLYEIDEFISKKKKPLSPEPGSERASELTSERSGAREQAVRVNEQTDERVVHYSMRLFLGHSAHRALLLPGPPKGWKIRREKLESEPEN